MFLLWKESEVAYLARVVFYRFIVFCGFVSFYDLHYCLEVLFLCFYSTNYSLYPHPEGTYEYKFIVVLKFDFDNSILQLLIIVHNVYIFITYIIDLSILQYQYIVYFITIILVTIQIYWCSNFYTSYMDKCWFYDLLLFIENDDNNWWWFIAERRLEWVCNFLVMTTWVNVLMVQLWKEVRCTLELTLTRSFYTEYKCAPWTDINVSSSFQHEILNKYCYTILTN